MHRKNDQKNVKLLKQFDTWELDVWWKSLNNRMPWLGKAEKGKGLLTAAQQEDYTWWGTIISANSEY